jgi:hypothetical protein
MMSLVGGDRKERERVRVSKRAVALSVVLVLYRLVLNLDSCPSPYIVHTVHAFELYYDTLDDTNVTR